MPAKKPTKKPAKKPTKPTKPSPRRGTPAKPKCFCFECLEVFDDPVQIGPDPGWVCPGCGSGGWDGPDPD